MHVCVCVCVCVLRLKTLGIPTISRLVPSFVGVTSSRHASCARISNRMPRRHGIANRIVVGRTTLSPRCISRRDEVMKMKSIALFPLPIPISTVSSTKLFELESCLQLVLFLDVDERNTILKEIVQIRIRRNRVQT